MIYFEWTNLAQATNSQASPSEVLQILTTAHWYGLSAAERMLYENVYWHAQH